MPKIYKRKCNTCGEYYEGIGKFYCSPECFRKEKGFQIGNKIGEGRPSVKYWTNKHFSTEHRNKISKANKGKKRSEETKKRMSIAFRGRIFSEEHKRKLSESHKGSKSFFWKGGISKDREYVKRQIKEWYEANKEHNLAISKKWYEENKERKYEIANKYRKKKRKENISFRLGLNIGTAISISLKDKKAGRHWETLVGYTLEDLMRYFEMLFDKHMNWQNYGSYWWIDHVMARSLFKYEIPEDPEFKKCWALENLRPLEKIENIKKGNKILCI